MSKVKKKEDKKKTISFSVDPRVYEMWIKYCEENGIENYSSCLCLGYLISFMFYLFIFFNFIY